jgi:hypothetical protein
MAMIRAGVEARKNSSESTPAQASIDVSDLSTSAEKLLYNISQALLGTLKIDNPVVSGTKATLKTSGSGGSSGGGGSIDTSGIETALANLISTNGKERNITSIPPVSIGSNGLGKDANNPIFISGGAFPSRQALAATFDGNTLKGFLTFNNDGAPGYSTVGYVKNAILPSWVLSASTFSQLLDNIIDTLQHSTDPNYQQIFREIIIPDSYIKGLIRTMINNDEILVISDGQGGYKLSYPVS